MLENVGRGRIAEVDFFTGAVTGKDDELLVKLGKCGSNSEVTACWSKLKKKYPTSELVHTPGVMSLLRNCQSDLWPEDVLCEILSAGATGPHVCALLDRAHERDSTRVLLAATGATLPERALVWALESSVKNMDAENSLDHLLRRQFSHNHLVGALRGMDSGMAIVLLDFLINKTRSAPFASKEGAVGIDDLARWIGAVIDAHPTTITNDGNEESLTDALQLVNDKLDVLAEYDAIEKLLAKNRIRSGQRSGGKYSVEILKL